MHNRGIRFLSAALCAAILLFAGAQASSALTRVTASVPQAAAKAVVPVKAATVSSASPSSALSPHSRVYMSAANRYSLKKRTYELSVVTPAFHGLADQAAQAELNAAFKAEAEKLIANFQADMADLEKNLGKDAVHMSLTYGFRVLTNTKKYYSVEVYTFSVQADAATVSAFYTVDKQTGKILTLGDFFKPNVDYVTPISNGIYVRMKQMNANEGGMFWLTYDNGMTPFSSISFDQSFYVDKQGRIVICFQQGDVAAMAQGSPQFTLNMAALKNILK